MRILTDWKQVSLLSIEASRLVPRSIDLTPFARFAPPAFREKARASLKALGDRIAAEFKNGVVNAFTATWIAAGLFALLGLIGAFLTRMPGQKVPARPQDYEPLEKVEVPLNLFD